MQNRQSNVPLSKRIPHLDSEEEEDEDEDQDFVPDEVDSLAPRSNAAESLRDQDDKDDGDEEDDDDDDDEAKDDSKPGPSKTRSAEQDVIDEEEIQALKREHQEMIDEAGGEQAFLASKRRKTNRHSAQDSDAAVCHDAGKAEEEAEAKAKAEAEAEWQAMKHSSTDKPPPSTTVGSNQKEDDMISVPQTYKFAGEIHSTTKLLPRSHPDAVAWLKSQSEASSSSSTTTTSPLTKVSNDATEQTSTQVPPTSSASSSTPESSINKHQRPGPRKKKTSSLAALSAAATNAKNPPKLNTLEKSKLDWETFKSQPSKSSTTLTQQELDELESQTKAGAKGLGNMKGYLERQSFLERVRERTSGHPGP